MNLFESCNRKYYYSLLGYKQEPNEIMDYGTEMHKILEKYNESLVKQKEFKTKIPPEYIKPFMSYKENILPKIEKLGYSLIPDAYEEYISLDNISGIIDVVFKSENEHNKYLVADYKTVPYLSSFNSVKYMNDAYFYVHLWHKFKKIPIENCEFAIIRMQQKNFNCELNILELDYQVYLNKIDSINSVINKINTSTGDIKDFPMVSINKDADACKYCDFRKSICKP